MNDWKSPLNVVYYTNPDYQYETDEVEEVATIKPQKQNLRIELDRRSRVSIYNTSGQLVYKKTANSTLNINNLSKGVYIIQIDKQTQKVII